MSSKDRYYGGGTSASRPTEEAEDETEHEVDTTAQHLAETSGFNIAEVSHEVEAAEAAEAQRQSRWTMPGAYHVRPLAAVLAEEEAAVAAQLLGNEAIPPTQLRRSSNALEDSDANSEEGPSNSPTASDSADDGTDVIDADVEAVAVPIDEAVSTYHAVPVVDALTTSRISEDGDELSSYQLESGTNNTGTSPLTCARLDEPSTQQESTSAGGSSTNTKKSDMENKYMIWSLAALLLVAVAMGLGLGLPRSQNSGETVADTTGNVEVTSYRLMEMEILPQIESSSKNVSSSVSLGLLLPTAVARVLSRSLLVGWDRNGGMVKVYRSQMKKGTDKKASFGPFEESASISLSDVSNGSMSDSSVDTGSAIIVDTSADGESFAVSHRNRIRMFSSPLHEAKRLAIIEKEDFGDEFRDKFLNSSTLSATDAANSNDTPDLWHQRGPTLVGDDDPAILGFGSSIGFSGTGLHSLQRVVIGSNSGHVRVYRLKYLNRTVPVWQRLDGGLLDPAPGRNIGKAVIAMAGSGVRFVVGYPSLGKVSLYQFIDEETLDENSSRPNFELVDEIYSKGNDSDMFGQSLSVDVFANFLVVGAKGYVRSYWLRVFPSSVSGFEYVAAGDKIVGEESDGEEFGSVVASGRVMDHNGGCLTCPFILDQQRIAISSPAYDKRFSSLGGRTGMPDGRGRVILYQYNEDEEIWQPLVSPIEGAVAGEGMAHAVKFSPDTSTIVTSSNFGDARVFRIQ
mmetsp:Transcript_3258/g.7465  ORF Transcript_3258/g.7465 Transcript_3258/m.7465 type:complete len:738 (-) Transcript_3258:35-2248(-)